MRALLWASTVGVTGAVVSAVDAAPSLKKDHILTQGLIELNKQIVKIEQEILAQKSAEEKQHDKFDAHATTFIATQNEIIRQKTEEKTQAESDATAAYAAAGDAKLDSDSAGEEALEFEKDITALKNAETTRKATFERNKKDLDDAVAEVDNAIAIITNTADTVNTSYGTSVHEDQADMGDWKAAQKAKALALVQKHMSKSAFMALEQAPEGIYVSGAGGGGWQTVTNLLSDLKLEFENDRSAKVASDIKDTQAYDKELASLGRAMAAAVTRRDTQKTISEQQQTEGDKKDGDARAAQTMIDAATESRDAIAEQQKESFEQYTKNAAMIASDLEAIANVKEELVNLGTTHYDDTSFGTSSSFVQLASTSPPSLKVLEAKQFLQREARHLHSKLLAQIAESSDVFARVKQLISDLITRLTTQANQEKSEQDQCVTKIKEADADLNHAKENLEAARLAVEKAKDDVVEYTHAQELATEELAAYETALNTLTEDYNLASATKKENKRISKETVSSLRAAKSILMQVLPPALLQTGSHTNAEPLANEYTSKVGSIMAMVNSLIEQFETYEEQMVLELNQDEAAFRKSQKTLEDSKAKAIQDKSNATTNLSRANTDKTTAEANVATSSDQLTASQSAWDATQKECVHAASYKERVAKREAEIASLKEALAILNSS